VLGPSGSGPLSAIGHECVALHADTPDPTVYADQQYRPFQHQLGRTITKSLWTKLVNIHDRKIELDKKANNHDILTVPDDGLCCHVIDPSGSVANQQLVCSAAAPASAMVGRSLVCLAMVLLS